MAVGAPGVVAAAVGERLLDGGGLAGRCGRRRVRRSTSARAGGWPPLAATVALRRHARGHAAGPGLPRTGGRDLRDVRLVVGSGGVLRHGGGAAGADGGAGRHRWVAGRCRWRRGGWSTASTCWPRRGCSPRIIRRRRRVCCAGTWWAVARSGGGADTPGEPTRAGTGTPVDSGRGVPRTVVWSDYGKRLLFASLLRPLAARRSIWGRSHRDSPCRGAPVGPGPAGGGRRGGADRSRHPVLVREHDGASRQRHDGGSQPAASRSEGHRDAVLAHRPGRAWEHRGAVFGPHPDSVSGAG